jgi:hypothetical protein
MLVLFWFVFVGSGSLFSPRQAAASVFGFVFLFTLEYESFVSRKKKKKKKRHLAHPKR